MAIKRATSESERRLRLAQTLAPTAQEYREQQKFNKLQRRRQYAPRERCEDCGKYVATKLEGGLYVHLCEPPKIKPRGRTGGTSEGAKLREAERQLIPHETVVGFQGFLESMRAGN
jgi:hypothetical protein